MKSSIRINVVTIPNKLRVDIRVSFDEKCEYLSTTQDSNLSLRIFPWITMTMIRPYNPEEGTRVWNPNDSVAMTTYSMPIFLDNLTSIQKGMLTPSLYSYTDNRLELNTDVAEKIRKVFMIGTVTIELSAVVVEQNGQYIEGIKMKYNNEESVVALSLNDIESLRSNLERLDPTGIALNAYFGYYKKGNTNMGTINPTMVDIVPK